MKNSFSDWLTSSELGRYLLEREQAYFDRAVADVFGFHAVQLGLPEVDFLRANRIPWQCRVAASGPAHIACNPEQLPFESRSLDLLVMPHVLDFTTVPHQVLREAERVLMPEGRLILTGFNPVSLWGVRRLIQGRAAVPWSGHFLSLVRIKDWLTLLELEPAAGGFITRAAVFPLRLGAALRFHGARRRSLVAAGRRGVRHRGRQASARHAADSAQLETGQGQGRPGGGRRQ